MKILLTFLLTQLVISSSALAVPPQNPNQPERKFKTCARLAIFLNTAQHLASSDGLVPMAALENVETYYQECDKFLTKIIKSPQPSERKEECRALKTMIRSKNAESHPVLQQTVRCEGVSSFNSDTYESILRHFND